MIPSSCQIDVMGHLVVYFTFSIQAVAPVRKWNFSNQLPLFRHSRWPFKSSPQIKHFFSKSPLQLFIVYLEYITFWVNVYLSRDRICRSQKAISGSQISVYKMHSFQVIAAFGNIVGHIHQIPNCHRPLENKKIGFSYLVI